MKNSLPKHIFVKSILAGALIALAGMLYLKSSDKVVGAFLFSLGLCTVFMTKSLLYTGRVGYIENKGHIFGCIFILIFNLIAAFGIGSIWKLTYGVSNAFDSRMTKTILQLVIDSIGCGAIIFLAVEFWTRHKSFGMVILCVMAFILAGFEHSIADMFYFAAGNLTWEGLLRLLIIILGNATGSLLIRLLVYGVKYEVSENK